MAPAAVPARAPAAGPAAAPAALAPSGSGGNMKVCGAQWSAMSQTQKDGYNAQAATMKSKSGGRLTGYNLFSSQCLRKR
jgi:hypothetical protein